MFIHWIFEGGKEKGLKESDPEPHRKHSVECSKETRQGMNVCKWKTTEKKKERWQWFWIRLHSRVGNLNQSRISRYRKSHLEPRWPICHLSHSSGFLFSMQWWNPCSQQHQFGRAAVGKGGRTSSHPALPFHTPEGDRQDSQGLPHPAPAPAQDWDSAQAVPGAALKRGWTE